MNSSKRHISYALTGVVAYLFILLIAYWWYPHVALLAVMMISLTVLVLYALLYELDVLYYAIVALVPLSENIRDVLGKASVVVPAEPLMAFLAFAVVIRWLWKPALVKALIKQPQHLLVLLFGCWTIITAVTSVDIIVSGKAVVMNTLFLLSLYFYVTDLFLYNRKTAVQLFFWFYLLPFLVAVGYTLYQHSLFDFTQRAANFAGLPFFNDHTVYAAIIVMLTFISGGFLFYYKNKWVKLLLLLGIAVFFVALVFSFSRAAWLSMSVALCCVAAFYCRMSFHALISSVLILSLGFIFAWPHLHQYIAKHDAVSGDDFVEHATSAINITDDVSNLERLNRWSCAVRVFYDYPLTGVGPANFKFAYADYQLPEETTNISVYDGSLGGTHSDYLKVLTETGFPGMLIFVAIILIALHNGMALARTQYELKQRMLTIAILAAFVSFLVHVLFNEFLDDVKAAVLFWAIIAYFNTLQQPTGGSSSSLS